MMRHAVQSASHQKVSQIFLRNLHALKAVKLIEDGFLHSQSLPNTPPATAPTHENGSEDDMRILRVIRTKVDVSQRRFCQIKLKPDRFSYSTHPLLIR